MVKLPTYYTVKFSDDEGYAGEVDFDTFEEAKKAFDELVKNDVDGVWSDYSDMELLKCGNGEEPTLLDIYFFEGYEGNVSFEGW